MSGPTKGMVAGQPIQTGALTKEYEDGFARTFGERKPQRGRWVWDKRKGEMVPAEEYVPEEPDDKRVMLVTDRHLEGMRATDGTDIGSYRKRDEYLKAHGLTHADDFKQHLSPEQKERRAAAKAQAERRALRETVGQTAYELKNRKRR